MTTIANIFKKAGSTLLLILMVVAGFMPGRAQDVVKYTLTRATNPYFGYTPPQPTQYEVGARIWVNADSLYIHNNYGFRFVNWTVDGEVFDTRSSIDFYMPERDMTLTANYVFDPYSPEHPDQPDMGHWLTVTADPERTGTFSNSYGRHKAGEMIYIYAYPKNGFKFVNWSIDDPSIEIADPTVGSLSFEMPDHDVNVVGHMVLDPTAPLNPGANMWNPTTGQMIVNDFTTGRLYEAINRLFQSQGSQPYELTNLKVIGKVNASDVRDATSYRFNNLKVLDLSRTDLTVLDNNALSGNGLFTVSLPPSLTEVRAAFDGCSNLTTIKIWATVPPQVTGATFANFPEYEYCILQVPAESIALYQADDYWGKMTILPLDDDVHNLRLTLPDDYNQGIYLNDRLELEDIATGLRQQVLVTRRQSYDFPNLPEGAMYNLYLYSPENMELARLTNILIDSEDLEVAFDYIKMKKEIYYTVSTSDNANIKDDVTIRWYMVMPDGTNAFLQEGGNASVVEGTRLLATLDLGDHWGQYYYQPESICQNIDAHTTAFNFNLQIINTFFGTGKVTDSLGMPISGATVTVKTICNGKYERLTSGLTDSQGKWNLTMADVDEHEISFAATDYVTRVETVQTRPYRRDVDFGTTALQAITGTQVKYGFTFTPAVTAGEDVETKTGYSDFSNVAFSVRNLTKDKEVNRVSVQQPVLALLDGDIEAGDRLRITATSKNEGFEPVVVEVDVNEELKADATFDIVELGGILTKFNMTACPAVRALLFDNKGNLLKSILDYEGANRFFNLPSGNYKVVTIGDLPLVQSVVRLSSLDDLGFVKDADYVINDVTVTSGVITEVLNDIIPALDTERFNYLTPTSLVSVNKTGITAGQNITVRCIADFKDSFRSRVSNVKLQFDMTDGVEMVGNSLMRGTSLVPYELTPGRIVLPLGDSDYDDQVRFVATPTSDGRKNITASFVFDLDGKTITQPVGTATFDVDNVCFNAPEIVSSVNYVVSGVAPPRSTVKVYEDDLLVGSGTVAGDGSWKADCFLINEGNLSIHEVYAEVETPENMKFRSKTVNIQYDKYSITLEQIIQINHVGNSEYRVVYDYATGNNTRQRYTYNPAYPDFTFMVVLSDNNPEHVSDLTLAVYTKDGDTVKFKPEYDSELGCWVASGKFTASKIPVNADAAFVSLHEIKPEYTGFASVSTTATESKSEITRMRQEALPIIEQMDALDTDDPNFFENLRELYIKFLIAMGDTDYMSVGGMYDYSNMTEEEYWELARQYEEWEAGLTDYSEMVDAYMEAPEYGTFDCGDVIVSLLPLSQANVSFSGWESEVTVDGERVYRNMDFDNGKFEMAFTTQGLYICSQAKSSMQQQMKEAMMHLTDDEKGGIKDINAWAEKIQDLGLQVLDKGNEVLNWITKLTNECNRIKDNIHADRLLHDANGNNSLMNKVLFKLQTSASAMSYFGRKCLIYSLNTLKYGLPVYSAYQFFCSAHNDVKSLVNTWHSVPDPCPDDEHDAHGCRGQIVSLGALVFAYTTWQAFELAASFTGLVPALAAAVPSGGVSLAIEAAVIAAQVAGCWAWERGYPFLLKVIVDQINKLTCRKDCNCKKGVTCICFPKCLCKNKKKPDPADGIIDPSGYVYEAVPSNRVQGVQSTIYYKEEVEDAYGDLVEQEFLWDAEEYAQRNPLFTDADGMYQWDVPSGLWQVRFKKDGYFDTQSEWLPVPPPQLDVNIPIIAKAEPQVLKARAYEEGVMIQFDKYMKPGTINGTTVHVTLNDEEVAGTLVSIDEEVSDPYAKNPETSTAPRYATTYRFNPETPLSISQGKIRLTVSASVEDYAGMNMAANFTQEFDIEKEIKEIRAAEDIMVQRGADKQLVVDVIPFDASAGRTLNVFNAAPLTLTVDAETVEIDENGQARFNVRGNLAGTSTLFFSIDDCWTKGQAEVAVLDHLYDVSAPVASRASGTQVYRGTRIELSTDVPDAIIYYTLDGTCPCDNDERLQYWMPIEVTGPTLIRAMLVTARGEESETVDFNYTLRNASIDLNLQQGWNWISHNVDREVSVAEVAADSRIERIIGAEGEAVGNAQNGISGTLTSLAAGSSYKVKASADVPALHLEGLALNPTAPIEVKYGLNWLGYAPEQQLSVGEAFANTGLENGDCLVGREGFSQYDGEEWEGTLSMLTPGAGYQFYSSSDKHVAYADPAAAFVASHRAAAKSAAAELKADTRKYPEVMCMIVDLADRNGDMVAVNDYAIGAFCGDECRGVGRVIGDKYMMSVYGTTGDEIRIVAIPTEADEPLVVDETFTHAEKIVGHVSAPYTISLPTGGGVDNVNGSNWKLVKNGDRLSLRGNTEGVKRMSLYDLDGRKVGETRNASQGIIVSNLTAGVYIVTIAEEGRNTFRKIVIR